MSPELEEVLFIHPVIGMLILVNDVFVEVLPPLVSVFPFGGIVAVLSDLLELLLPREEEFVVNLLIL